MSRGHVLTIKRHADWHEDEPHWDWDVTCSTPEGCGGWWECREPHEVEGAPADSGPYDCDESDPWCDEDEYEFHGVPHTWRYGWGWTVPYLGCIVQTADLSDDVYGIAASHGPGAYEIDDDWDDDTCYVSVIGGVQ